MVYKSRHSCQLQWNDTLGQALNVQAKQKFPLKFNYVKALQILLVLKKLINSVYKGFGMGKDHSKNRDYYYYLTLLYINGNYYIIFKDGNENSTYSRKAVQYKV